MRIWITGAGGLLGNHLFRSVGDYLRGAQVSGLTRADLDLTDFAALRAAFKSQRPELVIHCAALTRSPQCQANPALAHKLNVEATAQLIDLARQVRLIFLSTDLVFDGREPPYGESAQVKPLSVYAQTKAAAEQIVLANPKHTVVRTSLNGGTSPTGDRGFNEQMRCAWQKGQCLHLFTDEFRCPIPAAITARAIWELAACGQTGLFHIAGSERLSRWDIGQLLAARWQQFHPQLKPCSLKEYSGEPRAPDTSLNCEKAQKHLSFPLPGLTSWLAENPDISF
jgi:dTDP-4-dehydrorhamnose reductase